jgi:hypothetical protein
MADAMTDATTFRIMSEPNVFIGTAQYQEFLRDARLEMRPAEP